MIDQELDKWFNSIDSLPDRFELEINTNLLISEGTVKLDYLRMLNLGDLEDTNNVSIVRVLNAFIQMAKLKGYEVYHKSDNTDKIVELEGIEIFVFVKPEHVVSTDDVIGVLGAYGIPDDLSKFKDENIVEIMKQAHEGDQYGEDKTN